MVTARTGAAIVTFVRHVMPSRARSLVPVWKGNVIENPAVFAGIPGDGNGFLYLNGYVPVQTGRGRTVRLVGVYRLPVDGIGNESPRLGLRVVSRESDLLATCPRPVRRETGLEGH